MNVEGFDYQLASEGIESLFRGFRSNRRGSVFNPRLMDNQRIIRRELRQNYLKEKYLEARVGIGPETPLFEGKNARFHWLIKRTLPLLSRNRTYAFGVRFGVRHAPPVEQVVRNSNGNLRPDRSALSSD